MFKFPHQVLLVITLLLCIDPAIAARTDVVYMHNGDRVTGEIKSLFRGRLEFKTDHMGTLLIDWEDIEQVVSDTGQSVELTGGQRFYGSLDKPTEPDMLAVNTEEGLVSLAVSDISVVVVTHGHPDHFGAAGDAHRLHREADQPLDGAQHVLRLGTTGERHRQALAAWVLR